MFEKLVLKRLITRLRTGAIEERLILLRETFLSTRKYILLLTA